jgi:hypothetical protein
MNYLAVLVTAIVNMVIGALWYSPFLFAKPWMAFNNMTSESMKNVNPGPPLRTVVCCDACFVFHPGTGDQFIECDVANGWTETGLLRLARVHHDGTVHCKCFLS